MSTTGSPPAAPTTFSLSHLVLSHLPWVVLVVCSIIGFYAWRGEHDARLIAEQKVKADEVQVATLQTNIAQNNAAVAQLQEQQNARDAAAAKQIASLTVLVSKVQNPAQAVAALPQVSQLPVAPAVQPDSSVVFPAQDAVPLFQQLAQGKEDAVNLAKVTADLTDEKSVVAKDESTIADQTKQLALKDDEIKALRKKPSFWHRAASVIKYVGIGIGIGATLAALR